MTQIGLNVGANLDLLHRLTVYSCDINTVLVSVLVGDYEFYFYFIVHISLRIVCPFIWGGIIIITYCSHDHFHYYSKINMVSSACYIPCFGMIVGTFLNFAKLDHGSIHLFEIHNAVIGCSNFHVEYIYNFIEYAFWMDQLVVNHNRCFVVLVSIYIWVAGMKWLLVILVIFHEVLSIYRPLLVVRWSRLSITSGCSSVRYTVIFPL